MIDPATTLGSVDFWLQAFILVTGLTGQYLVGERKIRGFYFWIAGNFAIVTVSVQSGMYGMTVLYVIYTFMTVRCIVRWRLIESKEALNETGQPGSCQSHRASAQEAS